MFGASHQCHFLENVGNFQMLVCRLESDRSSLAGFFFLCLFVCLFSGSESEFRSLAVVFPQRSRLTCCRCSTRIGPNLPSFNSGQMSAIASFRIKPPASISQPICIVFLFCLFSTSQEFFPPAFSSLWAAPSRQGHSPSHISVVINLRQAESLTRNGSVHTTRVSSICLPLCALSPLV